MNPGPVVRGLIDTPVLIAYRDGWPDPLQFITTVRMTGLPEFSAVSALALYVWCQDAANLQGVQVFIAGSLVHHITAPISRRATKIMDQFPIPVPLTADESLVAATALELKLPLYTLDPARFASVAGLTVLRPY